MLDPIFIRDHVDEVRTGLRNRGLDVDKALTDIATFEVLRRRLIGEYEGLKRQQNTSGDEIAYTSDATNLSPKDRNGASDVYKTEFTVPSFSWKNARKPHLLTTRTTLVSTAPGGAAGNGPSSHGEINDAGDWVAFETAASNILCK